MENPDRGFRELATSHWTMILLTVIIAMGTVVRFHGIGDFWFNPDEGLNYEIAAASSYREMHRLILYQTHPPLYYYLLRWLGQRLSSALSAAWIETTGRT